MFCTNCNSARPNTEAPCPNCGAPSPLIGQSQRGGWGAGAGGNGNPNGMPWGAPGSSGMYGASGTSYQAQWEQQQVPQLTFDNNPNNNSSWQQPSGNAGSATGWQQQAFDQAPMPAWNQQSGQLNPMPSWQQTGDLQGTGNNTWQQPWSTEQNDGQGALQNPGNQSGQHNMLPVPYEGGMALEPAGRQPTISLQLVPEQAISHLLPGEPLPSPDVVRVPPMFTDPRPIIPKKRAINGLISVIIVALLLCTGAGYYAKASGAWDTVVRLYTGQAPANTVSPNKINIPDPPADKAGPASAFIPSYSLAVLINPKTNQPIVQQKIFAPGQKFWVTCSVQPPPNQTGIVIAKWYTNNHYFQSSKPTPVKYQAGNISSLAMNMQLDQPVSGRVELYWNNQLAQTLYFAVR